MEYITKTIIYNIISRLYWRLKDERIIVPQDQTMAAIKHILKGLQSREWKALKINSSSNDTINGITRKEWNQLTNYLINKKSKSAQYLWKSYLNALIVGPKIYTKIDPLAWQISWKKLLSIDLTAATFRLRSISLGSQLMNQPPMWHSNRSDESLGK